MQFFSQSEYQERVESAFSVLKKKLSEALPWAEIEHIGSSAIKGAVSKGDLDVLVRINRDEFPAAIQIIESLGFSIKQDTLRTESLCMLQGSGDTAIQLIERGSKFEMFIKFRDLMNASPELVKQYNQLKMSCAGLSEDEYRKRKSEFIQTLLQI